MIVDYVGTHLYREATTNGENTTPYLFLAACGVRYEHAPGV